MLKSPVRITQFIALIFMLLVKVVHAQNQCDCKCLVTYYGKTDLCKWLNYTSPKVDSIRGEISHLQKEMRNLLKDNDYCKKVINDKVLPFIASAQQATPRPRVGNSPRLPTETSPGNTEIGKDASMKVLAEEIEKLKQLFKDERDGFEIKIKVVENSRLQMKDELLAKITDAENRALRAENELLKSINEAKKEFLDWNRGLFEELKAVDDRTSKVKDEFSVTVNDMRKRLSEVKDEFSTKENEAANRTTELKQEVLKKVNEIQDRSLEERKELLTEVKGVEDALNKKLESERTNRNHLEETLNKTQDTLRVMVASQENTAVAIREEISSSAENLTAYIYDTYLRDIDHRVKVLEEEKYRNLDRRLGSLEAKIGNCTDICNNVASLEKSYRNLYNMTFGMHDVIEKKLLPGVRGLEEKSAELEKVLSISCLENICSDITKIWSTIKDIENNQQQVFNNQTESVTRLLSQTDQTAQKPSSPEVKTSTTTPVETIETTSATTPKYEPISSSIFSGFVGFEKCGDIDLSSANSGWNSGNGNTRTDGLTTKRRWPLRKFLTVVQRSPKRRDRYKNHCVAVRVTSKLAVAPDTCFKDENKDYRMSEEPAEGVGGLKWLSVPDSANQGLRQEYKGFVDVIRIPYHEKYSASSNFYACLPTDNMKDKIFGSATFVGWDDFEKGPDILSKLRLYEVSLITDSECQRWYGGSNYDHKMICTSYDKSVERSCKSSKGGLLFKEFEGKTALIGIVRDCGSSNKPILYTEISHALYFVKYEIK